MELFLDKHATDKRSSQTMKEGELDADASERIILV
jgi:hypothetical protein